MFSRNPLKLFINKFVSLSDEELMRLLIQKNEMKAFEELYRRYKNEIYSYLLRNTQKENAEELMQVTFMKVIDFKSSFRFESKFRTWIWTIARNSLIDYMRSNENKVQIHTKDQVDTSDIEMKDDAIEDILSKVEDKRMLKELIEKLNSDEKEVLSLFIYSELTLEEISLVTEFSIGKIKTLIHRSKLKITELNKMGKANE